MCKIIETKIVNSKPSQEAKKYIEIKIYNCMPREAL